MKISRSQFAAIQYRMHRRAQEREVADQVRSARLAARLAELCPLCGADLGADKPHEPYCEEAEA